MIKSLEVDITTSPRECDWLVSKKISAQGKIFFFFFGEREDSKLTKDTPFATTKMRAFTVIDKIIHNDDVKLLF